MFKFIREFRAMSKAAQLSTLAELRETMESRWSQALAAGEFKRADAYARAVYRAGRLWDALAFDNPDYRAKAIGRNAQLKGSDL